MQGTEVTFEDVINTVLDTFKHFNFVLFAVDYSHQKYAFVKDCVIHVLQVLTPKKKFGKKSMDFAFGFIIPVTLNYTFALGKYIIVELDPKYVSNLKFLESFFRWFILEIFPLHQAFTKSLIEYSINVLTTYREEAITKIISEFLWSECYYKLENVFFDLFFKKFLEVQENLKNWVKHILGIEKLETFVMKYKYDVVLHLRELEERRYIVSFYYVTTDVYVGHGEEFFIGIVRITPIKLLEDKTHEVFTNIEIFKYVQLGLIQEVMYKQH